MKFAAQKKDEKGRLVKETPVEIVPESTIEIEQDWEIWREDAESLALDNLRDDGSSGQKRRGLYQKTSRTTKWRRNAKSKKVDRRATLFNFGIKVLNED